MENNKIDVKIKLMHPDAIIPTVAYKDDVGYDIYALENSIIPYGDVGEIRTGIAFELPKGYYFTVETRSSDGKNGKVNHRGIVDPGFRGELTVFKRNISVNRKRTGAKEPLEIKRGDKIAQITIHRAVYVKKFKIVEELSETERGEKGYGSTGK